MVKFAHGNNALSEIWELEASSVEGQSLLQKDKKRGKRKGKEKKTIIRKCYDLCMPKKKCHKTQSCFGSLPALRLKISKMYKVLEVNGLAHTGTL